MVKLALLRSRISREADTRNLASELEGLAQNVERALENLAQGKALDEHLIQNASSIATRIARYNLLRDLVPYLEEEDPQP